MSRGPTNVKLSCVYADDAPMSNRRRNVDATGGWYTRVIEFRFRPRTSWAVIVAVVVNGSTSFPVPDGRWIVKLKLPDETSTCTP